MTGLPPDAKQIVGYCDPLVAEPGQEISFHVSCEPAVRRYQASIVRMLSGDPRPQGPGLRSAPVADIGELLGDGYQVRPGAYLSGPCPDWAAAGEWSLLTLVWPSRVTGTEQVLLAVGRPRDGDGAALLLDSELRPVVTAGAGGAAVSVRHGQALHLRRWYAVLGRRTGDGEIDLLVRALDGQWQHAGTRAAGHVSGAAGPAGGAVIGVGALLSGTPGQDEVASQHFTGRLERPAVIGTALDTGPADELLTCRRDELPGLLAGRERAVLYDLSIGIGGWTATDVGPGGYDATARNTPIRAVRGSRWQPGSTDWREVPDQYGAMHFNSDAVEDCGWPAAFRFTVPRGLASGFYAAHLTSGGGEDYVPFFVRPPAGATTSQVLLVAPTATYASYGNSRFWWEDPVQECLQDRLVEVGAEEQYLLAHPEIGPSSYDQHLDGTDVCYVSWRRPNLNMRPGHARYEGYTCDLYLIDWLDRVGQDVDVVTDDILHREGAALLGRYRVVMTGTHPEYMSAAEFDAFDDYVRGGGRLMYLGGNGFASNVSFDQHRPWIMENRRVDFWAQGEDVRQAESRNSIDGLRGGDLRQSGRHSVRLTGVETATMGFDRSYPYHRQPGSRDPAAAFAFAGVPGEVLGDFGLLGGGVVGQEWDNSAGHDPDPRFLLLGASRDHTLVPPLFGATKAQYHAELMLGFPGRGCVFSVSSMSWCGALSHEDYRNEIATMTGNVLRRFLDPAPLVPPQAGGD